MTASKALFSVSDFQAIGARAFAQGDARPEGTTWQARAKQKGFDDAKAGNEAPAASPTVTPESALVASVQAQPLAVQALDTVETEKGNIDIQQLVQQKQALDAQIASECAKALETVKFIVNEYGFKPNEVFASIQAQGQQTYRSTKGTKVQPKYRNPVNGAVWTGRGRAPLWIAGQDKEAFLIKG